MTPTARTLAHLRRLGYLAAVVELWIPGATVRRDLFGFADVLAVHPRDRLFLLVQATTTDHAAHRLGKAKARPELLAWLKAGGAFEVHGWTRRAGQRVRDILETLKPKPHLAVLGLTDWPCPRENILGAFRDKAKSLHPDRGGTVEGFQRLVGARDYLLKLCKK